MERVARCTRARGYHRRRNRSLKEERERERVGEDVAAERKNERKGGEEEMRMVAQKVARRR